MNNRGEIRDELNVKNQEVPLGVRISCGGRVLEPITPSANPRLVQ